MYQELHASQGNGMRFHHWQISYYFILFTLYIIKIRDGSVPKMCLSVGRQSKTVPIQGLRAFVHSIQQTRMFPLHNIAIKVPNCTKYEINMCSFFSDFRFVSNILSFPSII